jgi:acetyl esterase/lipase
VTPKAVLQTSINASLLIARFINYARNPIWGQTDGAFFVANPDYRIIRMIFNFPEKVVLKFIRKTFQLDPIKTDTKHYVDTSVFEEFMTKENVVLGQPRTMPFMLNVPKDGKPIVLSQRHLIGEGIFNKNSYSSAVRVRLFFFSRLIKSETSWSLAPKKDKTQDLAAIGLRPFQTNVPGGESPDRGPKLPMEAADAFQKIDKKIELEAIELGQSRKEVEPVLVERGSARKISVGISNNVFKEIKPSTITNTASPELKPRHINNPHHDGEIPSGDLNNMKTDKKYSHIKPSKNPRVKFDVDFDTSSFPQLLDKKERESFKKVIVHVHGGGFVAQSSSSHQVYLNRWANEFKIPIFSIDYRLAPTVHYPTPFDDVICGYLWIINYLEFVLKVTPERIVAVGDSAGGNLITGLTAWCLMHNVRGPDALCMFYPAMSLEPDTFTPSLLFSLNDFMLNYSSLQMCSEFYATGNLCQRNPFISPIYLPEEILAKFPKCEMFLCDRDPLRDDGMRFALKLHYAGGKVKVNYLRNLSHALLSMSQKGGLPEAMAFFEEAVKSMHSLLDG